MGVAIESGSMNIRSSAFAYVWPKKEICGRYSLTAFPFSCELF